MCHSITNEITAKWLEEILESTILDDPLPKQYIYKVGICRDLFGTLEYFHSWTAGWKRIHKSANFSKLRGTEGVVKIRNIMQNDF